MRKRFLMAFGIFVVCAMCACSQQATFADEEENLPEVKSAKEKCNKKGKCRCKTSNRFKVDHDVYAKGEHFPPLTTVDVYVTENRKWKDGDLIGADVSSDGANQVTTNDEGEFDCEMIWGNPLTTGVEAVSARAKPIKYDIVVDVGGDGTYNSADGDAVDGRSRNAGFKVKLPRE